MANLPNKEFRQLVPLMREKGFYQAEEERAIQWPEYNIAQIEQAKEILKFIRDQVDNVKTINTKGRVGRPLTDARSLARAVLVCEALSLTERAAQGWIEILGPFLGINERIDDRTIGEAYDRPEVAIILSQIFKNTKKSDKKLSGDGTGLETSRKQNYESSKKAGNHMTSIVDSREVVQAFDISGEQECRAMHKLIDGIYGDSLRLDAGFNDRELTSKIHSNGMKPFIFPRKDNNINGSFAWKNMYWELFLDVMTWLTEYHIRSHTESFHSSFKRRYGMITKRRYTAKLAQVTTRIILHNRSRLAYFDRVAS